MEMINTRRASGAGVDVIVGADVSVTVAVRAGVAVSVGASVAEGVRVGEAGKPAMFGIWQASRRKIIKTGSNFLRFIGIDSRSKFLVGSPTRLLHLCT